LQEYSHYADADADPKAIRDPYHGHEHADGFECGQVFLEYISFIEWASAFLLLILYSACGHMQ